MNPSSIKQLYEQTYQFINQINLGAQLQDALSKDTIFIDHFKCLLCNASLDYEPMDFLPIAEIGTCQCKNTFCARSIKESIQIPNQPQGVPIRDLVMTFPDHNWSIMVPCHGEIASWGASPRTIQGSSSISKIVSCSNAGLFNWSIKLDHIPDFFRNQRKLDNIINRLEELIMFA